MDIKIVTTITTRLDVDTFVPEHDVEIVSPDGVPESVARALLIHGHTHSDVRFQGREACVSWEAWGRLVGTGDLLPWLRLPWRPEVIEP